jgi:two-component system LytT family response regulator
LTLRAAIVDDEPLARQVLRELLATETGIEIVAECANGFEAVKAVQEQRPDLLLLDVQMPKLDGFEVLELVRAGEGRELRVIFVTAYDQYALRAFEIAAVDYLLKPVSRGRLRQALERARSAAGAPEATALAAAARPGPLQRIAVRDGARVTVIPATQLDFAEAQDDYVSLAAAGARHLKQQTLAALEAALDPAYFVRIHRRYLVRLDAIARFEPDGVTLRSGERLPVSRPGLARLRAALGER